ncbi:hypothetical protein DICA1_F28898 [Diutina catenulata]
MEEFEAYDRGDLLRDRYLKVGDLSEGSYGMVSMANDTKASRIVAVKFIYPVDYKKRSDPSRPSSSPVKMPEGSNRPSQIARNLSEIANKEIAIHNILGSHPNITTLYDHFGSFLVLEYCSRGDLYETIQNGTGPALSHDIKEVFGQILSALEFCHSHSVYHRDLKPENILIAEDWSIKLCDWGLATTQRLISNRAEFDVGSERYMAPELFDEDITEYDAAKIDLWSVGIILLTLVFHKNPFSAANYSDKRFIQFSSNREALFDFFSTMSSEMFAVLRHSLNIDPSNRDLGLLRHELASLKYFTIDEEYWGDNDSDVEEEDEEYPSGSEEEVFPTFSASVSPAKSQLAAASPAQVSPPQPADRKVPVFAIDDSDKRGSSEADDSSPSSMPHNPRADALLSSTTNLKPIPIGGAKFVRNTRKPFNVASYNQGAQTMKNGHRGQVNFNREDFFTPKSVFNHYMDKYGEQRNLGGSRHHRKYSQSNGHGRQYWKKKRKARTWKKKRGANGHPHGFFANGHANGPANGHANGYLNGRARSIRGSFRFNHKGELNHQTHHQGEHSDRTHNRRKSYSAAVPTKPRGPKCPPLAATAATGSAPGKYVPPYLRSPCFDRPVDDGRRFSDHSRERPGFAGESRFHELAADMDGLNLGPELDEVFHLEDDFDSDAKSTDDDRSNRRARERPLSGTDSKYVPPFRRGSIGHGTRPSGLKDRKDDYPTTHRSSPLGINIPTSSTSVPVDNYWPKKDWTDYD